MIAIPGFVLFLLAGVLGEDNGLQGILLILGFGLFFVGILSTFITGKCLKCDRCLGMAFNQCGGPPWRISEELCFCPYCGHSLDNTESSKKGVE